MGTFSNRASGMPLPGAAPHQRLVPGTSFTIDYGYHWETGKLLFNYSIRANVEDVGTGDGTLVGLGLGVRNGSSCELDSIEYDYVATYTPEAFVYDSGDESTHPRAGDWDCAVLLTTGEAEDAPTYDAYVAPLQVTTARPRVRLQAARSARLVRGAWTEVPVRITVPEGSVKARNVTVTGTGRGVRVRKLVLGALQPGSTRQAHVWVRLSRARTKVRLVVRDRGDRLTARSVTLRQRPAPAPPRAGTWQGPRMSFKVGRGKVRRFRISALTTCGGYPDLPTRSYSSYDFPTVSIPRNNLISQGRRGNVGKPAAYTVHLRMNFVSRNRVRGTFSYNGPNRCTATEHFVAKRR